MVKTKEEIIENINELKKRAKNLSKMDMQHSAAFYRTVIELADQFAKEVERTVLFNQLEKGWLYDIGLDYEGCRLLLVHHECHMNENGDPDDTIDQTFVLITTPAPYLNTAQYAKAYGIEEVTVRAWIRRGKLRAAKRVGNEWQIPVLLDYPRQRGYKRASYSWDRLLSGLPEDLNYFNDYRELSIEQNNIDKKKYNISLRVENDTESSMEIVVNQQERERIELVLISNNDVRYDARLDEGIIADLMFGMDGE